MGEKKAIPKKNKISKKKRGQESTWSGTFFCYSSRKAWFPIKIIIIIQQKLNMSQSIY